jgi:hypothetical protein
MFLHLIFQSFHHLNYKQIYLSLFLISESEGQHKSLKNELK